MDKTTVFGVIGVFIASGAFALGAIALGLDQDSTPIVSSILSTGGLITVTLLAGQRTNNKVAQVESKVDDVLNGVMESKIQNVLVETLSDDVIDPERRNGNDDETVTEP